MENEFPKHIEPTYHQINLDTIIQRLLEANLSASNFCLSENEAIGLCYKVRKIFIRQPMLLEMNAPVNICGDVHGQFKDLRTIFKKLGTPDKTNYLFLGDYVDRGKHGLQCIFLLFAYKIKYPENFFMLRGNHECSEVNRIYGFYDECKQRINIKLWKTLTNCFNFLPIAAVVGQRIFCCHGGLSPYLRYASEINLLSRPILFTKQGVACDILWSDPSPDLNGFSDNLQRGVSYYFGVDVLDTFIKVNDFDMVCRSHQVVEQGYQFFHQRKLVTLFSAPNYCGFFNNAGALMVVSKDMVCRIQVFEQGISLKSSSEQTPSVKPNRRSNVSPFPKDGLKSTNLLKRSNSHNIDLSAIKKIRQVSKVKD